MSSAIQAPRRRDYIHLRHPEPFYRRAHKRWECQLYQYGTNLFRFICSNQVTWSSLACLQRDITKLANNATSWNGKRAIQNLKEAVNRVCKNYNRPSEDDPSMVRFPEVSLAYVALLVLMFSMGNLPFARATFPETSTCRGVVSAPLFNGVGNQLFQAASAIAAAKDMEVEAVFPPSRPHVSSNLILRNLQRFEGRAPNLPIVKEAPVCPSAHSPRSMMLLGLFQSPQYFHHQREELLKIFGISLGLRDELEQKYGSFLGPNTVAVHVRRGDYLTYRVHGKLVLYNVAESPYYEKALQGFNKNRYSFLVFSDEIEFAQRMGLFKNLKEVDLQKVHFVTGQEDYKDFYLMMLCSHFVIPNSTFSWWAAYLSQALNKTVTIPMKWWHPEFAPFVNWQKRLRLGNPEIALPEWTQIDWEDSPPNGRS